MTFYFYDLETTGTSPRRDRVIQFAGQRTDMDLKPVGEPDNILIKLTPDILPQPDAVLVTGITPQQAIADGITEAEFLKYFMSEICVPNTIMVGYNNVRFDDEFMRFMLWRNYYDAYEWQWKDGCSRWDLLDMVRMTRALRPEGIKWPFASDGKPSNRLELVSSLNKLEHVNAHDALSDVVAAIEVARLIKTKQPKLFDYLFNLRDKKKAGALVNAGQPFVYSSGKYPSEFEKTAVVVKVADAEHGGALVYDLRIDPDGFTKLSAEQLAELWSQYGKEAPYFPVKQLAFNKCPAIAPLNVVDEAGQERLKIDLSQTAQNHRKLQAASGFGAKLQQAQKIIKGQFQASLVQDPLKAEEQLYDGFVNDADKTKMSVVRAASVQELGELQLDFDDDRLDSMLPLYKARNYPKSLSQEEREAWEKYRRQKLASGGDKSQLNQFFARLNQLAQRDNLSDADRYLLEELNLYGQSIAPTE